MVKDNKRRIVDITFALSIKHGFDNVSIKQIQTESELSAGSIYYYFKDKDEILASIMDIYLKDSFHALKNEIKMFNGSLIDKIRFIFNYKSNSFNENEIGSSSIPLNNQFSQKDYWVLLTSIYHEHPESRSVFYEIQKEVYDLYYDLVQEAIEKNEIRDDIDTRTIVIFIQTCLKGYLDLWVYQPSCSFDEIVDSNIKMISEAIKKR